MALPAALRELREKTWVGAASLASVVGVSRRTIVRWCQAGKIPCMQRGKFWFVNLRKLSEMRENDVSQFLGEMALMELRNGDE